MTEFTPFASLAGGVMIGLAAVVFMAANGRIAGISGIVAGLLPPVDAAGAVTRLAFVAGLVAAPLAYFAATGAPPAQTVTGNLPLAVVAGLLVGFGAVHGGGCTSGHGVCGLSRLSARSAVATVTFMAAAAIVVFVTRHVLGG